MTAHQHQYETAQEDGRVDNNVEGHAFNKMTTPFLSAENQHSYNNGTNVIQSAVLLGMPKNNKQISP